MFTTDDLSAVSQEHFDTIDVSGYWIVIRSRSTGHYWCLQEQITSSHSGHRSVRILHRHHEADQYHVQAYRPSIEACCAYIVNHDSYHLEREAAKQERRKQAVERRRAGRAGREVL